MDDQIQTQNGLDALHPHAKTLQMNLLTPLSGAPTFSQVHLVVASKSSRMGSGCLIIPEHLGKYLQVCH